jgi:RNA polymerase sigma-70 factor, ECF subfamily
MQENFTAEFEKIRPQLRSYLLRMTASRADTDDIVQETWIKAHANLASFQGNSTMKTWIFSIATNLAKDNRRYRNRWTEDVTDTCKQAALGNPQFFQEAMTIRHTSPQGNFEIREQQVAVFLKEVYEFKVAEIAEIMGSTEAMVKYYLHVGRAKMMDIFDRRCALINKEGICHQCTELNGIFNPKQNAQEELMKIEMAREAGNHGKESLFDLRMKILQELDPFESGAAELQIHHLEHNRGVMERVLENA